MTPAGSPIFACTSGNLHRDGLRTPWLPIEPAAHPEPLGCFSRDPPNSFPTRKIKVMIRDAERDRRECKKLVKLDELRGDLVEKLHGWSRFFLYLTQNALRFRPPIGFFNKPITCKTIRSTPHMFDLSPLFLKKLRQNYCQVRKG